MVEEIHYSQREVGELPIEKTPSDELRSHILRDGWLTDQERIDTLGSLLTKTPEELRAVAGKYDSAADEASKRDNFNIGLYNRNREYGRLLSDLADNREEGPLPEIDAQEAVTEARATYQTLLTESKHYEEFITSELASSFWSSDDPETIKMKIDEFEQNGSIPALLVALLERLPGLKEYQKLGSLARNRFRASQLAKLEARKTAVDISENGLLGDHRDQLRKDSIEEDKKIAASASAEYRVLKEAVRALRQSTVS